MKGVRLGLMVRSDHRGIGMQSRALYEHLKPARTLHISMTNRHGSWTHLPEHPSWYPDARNADFNGHTGTLDEEPMHWLLAGSDVVLMVESPMDYRLFEWARTAGVRTAVVANPEFIRSDVPQPDRVILPSLWRASEIEGIHLPHPVDRARFAFQRRPLNPSSPPRFLHVIGHRAIHDRAGTDIILEALWRTRNRIDMTIRAQESLNAPNDLRIRQLRYERKPKVLTTDIEDPADLYRGFDVLVAPRRYGGLSLPIGEAASCGLAVLATNRAPEHFLLPAEALIPTASVRYRNFQAGLLPVEDADPRALAEMLDRLVEDPGLLARLSSASDRYAESISWETLGPRWEAFLASLVERDLVP